jgi:hypothetical protein
MFVRFYYSLFVSSIWTIRTHRPQNDIWEFYVLFLMSVAMFLNVIFGWFIIRTHFAPEFTNFMVLPLIENTYNGLINFVLYVLIPIMAINYYLIFYKQKYLQLMDKYAFAHKKSISAIYYLVSWFGLSIYFVFVVV